MNEFENPGAPLGPSDAQIARMHAAITAKIAADVAPAAPRRKGRNWLIGGTLGLLVLLAGGTSAALATGVLQAPSWFTAAPAPGPTVSQEPAPEASETPAPSQTPAPTPTKPAVFSATCDQLVPGSLIASISPQLAPMSRMPSPQGFAGTTLDRDDVATGWGAFDLAAVGQGYFSCGWDTEQRETVRTGGAEMITLSGIPQATAAASPEKETYGTLASLDQAQVECFATVGDGACSLNALQDGVIYTAQVWVKDVETPTLSPKIVDELTEVLRGALPRIAAEGVAPTATAAPSGRWAGIGRDCTVIDTAIIAAQPSAVPESHEAAFLWVADATWPGYSLAVNNAGFRCQVNDKNGQDLSAQVMPGLAARAWSQATAGMTPLTVAGTSAAVTASYENSGAIVVANIDGALVVTSAPDAATAAKLMASIAQRTAG